jgi:hypothetical protein
MTFLFIAGALSEPARLPQNTARRFLVSRQAGALNFDD